MKQLLVLAALVFAAEHINAQTIITKPPVTCTTSCGPFNAQCITTCN